MKRFTLSLIIYAAINTGVFAQCTQPMFNFQSPSKVSGSANSTGAVYKYTNVLSGVDAFVTILSMHNASIVTFDDDGSGYPRAFQPEIKNTSVLLDPSWVKYKIQFKYSSGALDTLPCIAMSIVDLDGGLNYQERISTTNVGSYQKNILSLLSFTQDSFFNVRGAALNFNNIDTSAKEAMAQVNYVNTNTLTLKVGTVGILSNTSRQYSLYFQSFKTLNLVSLPVSMVAFDVNSIDKTVQLNWATSKEINNDRFEIERRQANGEFVKIGEVQGNGNSDQVVQYSFTDYVAPGTYIYRLRQIDYNGKESYSSSQVVSVGSIDLGNIITQPNPFETTCTVSFYSENASNASVRVMNAMGQTIYNEDFEVAEGNNYHVIDLSEKADGLYFIETKTSDRILVSRVEKKKN